MRIPVPSRVLQLGSGKSFRPEWWNLDGDPRWHPDLVHDLNEPLLGRTFTTERFGTVTIEPEMFDSIVAIDVLEHVRELTVAMTSCLQVLRTGGVFRISVPYELSVGAWSDPTHVRAFNERSWDYYGRWCWYLDWRTHCLSVTSIDYVMTELGEAMQAAARPLDEILRTPRAIDAMRVELVKVEIDASSREKIESYTAGWRSGAGV